MNRCCETCRYDLGGGYNNCRINVEAECGAGGFEAWEPKGGIENGVFIIDIVKCLEEIRKDGIAYIAEQLACNALEKINDTEIDREEFIETFKMCIMDRVSNKSDNPRTFADIMEERIRRRIECEDH